MPFANLSALYYRLVAEHPAPWALGHLRTCDLKRPVIDSNGETVVLCDDEVVAIGSLPKSVSAAGPLVELVNSLHAVFSVGTGFTVVLTTDHKTPLTGEEFPPS